MPFIPPEAIERARQMDLLTYLQTFEPNELVHIGGSHYCTREHDSLKISNGKWYWFSRGFGGYNALDYWLHCYPTNTKYPSSLRPAARTTTIISA